MQKRSRPGWLNGDTAKLSAPDYDSKVKERDPLNQEPKREVTHSAPPRREAAPIPQRVHVTAPIAAGPIPVSSSRVVPLGNDLESRVVREYLERHAWEEKNLAVARTIADCVSAVLRVPFRLVGSIVDGTASRDLSFDAFSIVPESGSPLDRSDVFESLRAAGPARGWTVKYAPSRVDTLFLIPLSPRGLTVFVRLRHCSVLIKRTQLVQTYASLIEPRMTVALAFIRSCLTKALPRLGESEMDLDYFTFALLWRALVEKRVIPDLVSECSSDKEIWADLVNSPIQQVRKRWLTEGIHVGLRMSVVDMIRTFLAFGRDVLDPESGKSVLCPVSNSAILQNPDSAYKIWQALCFLKPSSLNNQVQ